MIHVTRAADWFADDQPGITSRHCFSAGSHYDPSRLGVGPLIGVDEHVVAPGAGFADHAHRGVDIVTWVLEGALTHEGSLGHRVVLHPGDTAVLRAAHGVRHEERNAGAVAVRFTQSTVLAADGSAAYAQLAPPIDGGPLRFDIIASGRHELPGAWAHLALVAGEARLIDATGDEHRLTAGDAAYVDPVASPAVLDLEGTAQLWTATLRE